MSTMDALRRAIAACGSQAELARRVGVKNPSVSEWLKGGQVPPERVIEVYRASAGAATPHQLRPDLYPHPLDGRLTELQPPATDAA